MEKLTAERWHQIKRVFDRAIEVPPAERGTWLTTTCGGDTALLEEVRRMLAAAEAQPDFLEKPAIQLRTEWLIPGQYEPRDEPQRVPLQVGPYRLVREIGQGGMGTVYLGERADGEFEHRVAVKILRRRSGRESYGRRFRHERQILASLNHPGIAQLYDGGVVEQSPSDDGLPFIVMEYVEGEPLDRYCDERRLSIDQRLRLFNRVGEAVQYAHRALVVHRDLKPANILVTAPSSRRAEEAQIKLLDFGLAKLLEDDPTDAAPLTRTGEHLMTPEYASPEQVKGEPITTASDVYQLGVVLYELLTGRRPYRTERGSMYEIQRAICEDEPARPSSVVAEASSGPGGDRPGADFIARRRGLQIEQLKAKLRGDLDEIVLKALRKDPADRYASVGDFKTDIDRYLRSLPVEARQGSTSYRVRKFVRRHRWSAAAGAVIALLVVGYAATVTLQAREIAAERDRVQIEAEKAEQVTAFLTSILEADDPMEAQGDTVRLREVLERGVARIHDELAEQPDVQAELYFTTGTVYRNLGNYEAADSLLRSALALRSELAAGKASAAIAEVQRTLARLRMDQGEFAAAETLQRAALEQMRALHSGDHEDLASDLVDLAETIRVQGRHEEAEPLYHEAIAMYRRLFEGPNEGLATTLNNLGLLYHETRRYNRAGPLYREALDMQRAILGERHPYVTIMRHNLAGFLRTIGDYKAADSLFRLVVATDRDVLGDEHPATMASVANLGITLRYRGDFEGANRHLQEAISTLRAMFDPSHPGVVLRLANLAYLRLDEGRFAAAESLIHDVKRLRIDRQGASDRIEARALEELGLLYRRQGRYSAAARAHQRALELNRASSDESGASTADLLLHLSLDLQAQGDQAAAERRAREALEIRRRVYGEEANTADALTHLGALLTEQGRLDEAMTYFSEADSIIAHTLPRGNRFAARLGLEKARLLLAAGRHEAAHAEARAVHEWYVEQYVAPRSELAEAKGLLGASLAQMGRFAEGEDLLRQSVSVLTRRRPLPHVTTREMLQHLVALYQAWGRPDASEPYREMLVAAEV